MEEGEDEDLLDEDNDNSKKKEYRTTTAVGLELEAPIQPLKPLPTKPKEVVPVQRLHNKSGRMC